MGKYKYIDACGSKSVQTASLTNCVYGISRGDLVNFLQKSASEVKSDNLVALPILNAILIDLVHSPSTVIALDKSKCSSHVGIISVYSCYVLDIKNVVLR